ncbi:hypothetical protein [Aliikangiella maris]|uniref:Uncharacterized protein n=2 Tax=Aliikangiella maris TaxID=3162458 RepID=A0ABV2BVY9_9GAMM
MKAQEKKIIDNPYQAPESHIDPSAADEEYTGKLYSIAAISIATIFGSFLAAGILLQSNFNKFKQSTAAFITIIFTTVATIVFLFTSLFVEQPSLLLYFFYNFLAAVLILPISYIFQGEKLLAHEQANYPVHSLFKAILIGIACFFAMGLMLSLAVLLLFIIPIDLIFN